MLLGLYPSLFRDLAKALDPICDALRELIGSACSGLEPGIEESVANVRCRHGATNCSIERVDDFRT